jgi:arylsulfatase A-like enzyme/Tfp pilus assembly protein PilF
MLDCASYMSSCKYIALLFLSLPCLAASRNVILITMDTTRADRMGFLGSNRGLTPHLDALAHDSVIFPRAYSQAPVTTDSHATILSGTYPQFHKVNDAGVPLAKDIPYAPAIFRAHGYQTAAFVGAVILDPKAGAAPGFDRGFDTYDAGFHERGPNQSRYDSLERRGDQVVAHALAWLGKHQTRPFFLWVHLYDPHAPYDPPEPYRSRFASDPYDGEIAFTDSAIGTLLDALRSAHLYDNAVIAVMADHGEALGEHGELGHGVFLYAPTIHVPLLLKVPGDNGMRIDTRVSLVDVLPTVLETASIPAPAAIQGKSMLPLIHASGAGDRNTYAETDYPNRAFGWSSLRATRSGKYLFVEAPRKELYDEQADPGEEHNLSSSATAVAGTLQSQLDQFRAKTSSSRTAPKANVDPGAEEKLRALGYVASSNGTAAKAVGGIDPKDKIALANEMTAATLALEEGRPQEAILRLRGVIGQDENFAAAYSVLGSALLAAGNNREAIPVLRKAVELRPDSVSSHYDLGMALFQVGDVNGAAPQFEAAVAGFPESADMHYSLASVYVRINRMADARKQLEKALALRPNDFDANLMLGQVFLVQKSPAAALPYLLKAEKLHPEVGQVHHMLADAYTQLGRKPDAEREQTLAQKAGH